MTVCKLRRACGWVVVQIGQDGVKLTGRHDPVKRSTFAGFTEVYAWFTSGNLLIALIL
jgi:hypothetical protein